MNDNYNSTLTWLDSSEQERRAVLDLVSALSEPGTLDELGIGAIRDTISDVLFPGTSTIQTRARYFLFIPWILQIVERRYRSNPAYNARRLQLELCSALDDAHGANEGVIGREAGATLRTWPISIYWNGLERWGVRQYRGSISSYYSALRRPPTWLSASSAPAERGEDGSSETEDRHPGNWAPIPPAPKDFPGGATFELTPDEAGFLSDSVRFKHNESFLAHLLEPGNGDAGGDVSFPWEHRAARTAPTEVQSWLHDARLFSLVHRGAALLYSLMLADMLVADGYDQEHRVKGFSREFAEWSREIEASLVDIRQWDRAAMWRRILRANPRIRPLARQFADGWYSLVSTRQPASLAEDPEARDIIRNRERALKGARARLSNSDARAARRGYPASGRLEFRWSQVMTMTNDILSSR